MKLYWCPRTRALRAVWMLEEAGVSYERVHFNIRGDPNQRGSIVRHTTFLVAAPPPDFSS